MSLGEPEDLPGVVQEIALAADVVLVCGSQELDWSTFCLTIETGLSLEVWEVMLFGIMDTDGFKHYKSMKTIQRAIPADTPGDRLLELLIHLREHEATDERDKVFSVLGLLDTSLEDLGVLPDYQDSSLNIFKKTAVSIIESSKNLDVLGVCSTNQFSDFCPALPSWVPDWRYKKWIPSPSGRTPWATTERRLRPAAPKPVRPFSAIETFSCSLATRSTASQLSPRCFDH
jgi:hypothetical protein